MGGHASGSTKEEPLATQATGQACPICLSGSSHTHTHTHTHTERDVCLASENIDFGHQERSRQEINCVEVVCIARKIISAALTIVSYSDSIGIGKGN